MVLVGRISRPHGLRGQVVVTPETDFTQERFAAGATLWTRSPHGLEALTIASARLNGRRPIIGFAGFDRIEDVERLSGQELRIPEDQLQPLEGGTFYEHQLAGCEVVTAAGEPVGTVRSVEGPSGSSRLVIDGPRGEVDIPLASDICREIDIAAKRIVIEPPEGLLELNERGAAEKGTAAGGRNTEYRIQKRND